MKIYILLICFALCMSDAMAQTGASITGTITQNQKAAEGATVSLLKAKDSASIKFAAVGKDGRYTFDQVASGKYLISVTSVGHQKAYSTVIDVNADQQVIQLEPIGLIPAAKSLADVTVTAKRPLIEQRIDRTILNVESSITNIGTSALEVLEKAPGVSVDRDGNVSLKGKQGVTIMVDGRPSQLSGADLANLLRNMNSSQLDQIEIMTNPPARYDAAGTSGIINIKTKKSATAGLNGSVSLAYGQGKYPKTNEGFNFNYREGKVNFFSNLSHTYMKRYSRLSIDRNILNSNSNEIEQIFNQDATILTSGNAYSAKFGADYFATKKTTIGAVINLNARNTSSISPNTTTISNAAKNLESTTNANVNNDMEWKSISANLNMRTILDKKGREITADLDFVNHSTESHLFMVNRYTNAFGEEDQKSDTLTGMLPQQIDVYSARVDYVHPVSKTTNFEAGVKSSVVRTDNNARYDSIQYGEIIQDLNRSNHFIYEENINAAYANLNTPLSKKITVQLGLRLENTNAKGRQRSTGDNFDRHYTQLFPTAYFQYKANDNNNFGANFGRRVRRPSYQSLNPFIRFIDRYTYSQGNPNLKPSVSSNIELSHTWKNQITTTLNYTYEKDIIREVIQQKGQEAYNMPANVSSLNQFGLAISANTPITPWWKSNINFNVFNDNYKGVVNNAPIDLSATGFVLSGTQQFKVTRSLTAELNGMMRSGWLEGVIRVKAMGFLGAGISQQILKNKGIIRFTARDVLHSQRMKGKSRYGNVDFALMQMGDTRVFTLGFTYSFSKGKKIAPVKRSAGSASEEQNRIGQ